VDYRIFVSEAAEGELPIRTLLKKVDGAYYLFVVNVENKQYDARIEMPGNIRDLQSVVGAQGAAKGRSITDVLEPLGVRVYRFGCSK